MNSPDDAPGPIGFECGDDYVCGDSPVTHNPQVCASSAITHNPQEDAFYEKVDPVRPIPCPFCGGGVKIEARRVHDAQDSPHRLYWVVCNTYGCGVAFTHGEWVEPHAVERWNKRANKTP